MSFIKNVQTKMNDVIIPVMGALGKNKYLKAISGGMMSSLPITVGAAIFSLLGSFPYEPYIDFIKSIGLSEQLNAVSTGTLSLLAVYVAFLIAYRFAENEGIDPLPAGIFSLATFFIVIPQSVKEQDKIISALPLDYLGGAGIFVAMILSLLIAKIYCTCVKKGIVIKMPESVQSMVSKSLTPVIIGIIIAVVAFAIRYGFAITSFGSIFNFITVVVAKPIMAIGTSIPALIFIFTIVLWDSSKSNYKSYLYNINCNDYSKCYSFSEWSTTSIFRCYCCIYIFRYRRNWRNFRLSCCNVHIC